ncbi:MAG: hypothetical protein LBI87_12010 [Candidatus Accumulibacter sp.]|jgi:hypothetical protein|nr:hypothetical protein [Accumulibacter sp.]
MDDNPATVVMESSANYRLGGGALKPGKARLTSERFCLTQTSQNLVMMGTAIGVVVALVIVTSIFGLTSGSYVGAALKGSLTGAAGGAIGEWLAVRIERSRPQKPGVTVFSVKRQDIASVNDGRFSVRTTLEV